MQNSRLLSHSGESFGRGASLRDRITTVGGKGTSYTKGNQSPLEWILDSSENWTKPGTSQLNRTSCGWKKPYAAPSVPWRQAKCPWERSSSAPGRVVGRGWNRNLTDNDPTAHAEIVALREAGRNLGNHRLGDCELFATIEPCAMCAGAAVHARVRRLVYGADDPKAGAVHSVLQVVNHPSLNHQMEIRGGVLAGRAAEIVQEFFRQRR